jgi:hypothetical protein
MKLSFLSILVLAVCGTSAFSASTYNCLTKPGEQHLSDPGNALYSQVVESYLDGRAPNSNSNQ